MRRSAYAFLAFGILLNLFFLSRNTSTALTIYRLARHVPIPQRRMLFMPSLYRDVVRIRQEVPEDATLWYVAPNRPHVIAYFLYPRIIRWGSPSLKDLNAIRQAHPADWTLTNHSMNPADDTVEILPPLNGSRPHLPS